MQDSKPDTMGVVDDSDPEADTASGGAPEKPESPSKPDDAPGEKPDKP